MPVTRIEGVSYVKPPHCPKCATVPAGELVVEGGTEVGDGTLVGTAVVVGAGAEPPSHEKTEGPVCRGLVSFLHFQMQW